MAHTDWLAAATILGLSIAGSPGIVYAMLVVFAVWALWEIGATGGADAKIIIALVLFFANGLLFIPIVLVGGVQGLVGLIARRKTIPYTVAITLGTVAWLWMDQLSRDRLNLERKEVNKPCGFLRDRAAIETSEVAVIIAVVVLVAYGAYQLLGARIAQVVQDVAGRL